MADIAGAFRELERAIAGDPEIAEHAREHDDLASVRDDPDFVRLTA